MNFVRAIPSRPAGPVARVAVAAFLPAAAVALVSMLLAAAYESGTKFSSEVPALLAKWTPLLARGFVMDIAITTLAMGMGTALGVMLGVALLARNRPLRLAAWAATQLLRNTPGLVFLFFVAYALPFTVAVGGVSIAFPAWAKAVLAFSLKIMANVAEIVRGAVNSVPLAQWEAAQSLAFTRGQTLRLIVLPQCIARAVPPWMNVYALFFTAVPLTSLIGVSDALTYANLALKAEMRPELIVPIYLYVLAWFFAVAHGINKLSAAVERAYSLRA